MKHQVRAAMADSDPIRAALRNFLRKEDGVVTALACFIIVMMLLVGGIGVDLMRNEMERVKVQNVSDRAVLAAADLDQTLDPESVVRDYFAKAGLPDTIDSVSVGDSVNVREVTVTTSSSTPTRFMRFMGVDQLPLPTRSAAEEAVNLVEVSLVLDISGSMANNNKMTNLQEAAGEFIDTVLQARTQDRISISLIPYSEHVNAGPELMRRLRVNQRHNFSHCIEFDDVDYETTILSRTKLYEQMQHFQYNLYNINDNHLEDTICPRYAYERILPFSQNGELLKQQINAFQPRAGTAIYMGMKWGAGMLDPDLRPIVNSLSSEGLVDGKFAARPASWNAMMNGETLKTIILMTDGQNSRASRIPQRYYETDSQIMHWSRYNAQWFNYHYNWPGISTRPAFFENRYTEAEADALLYKICDAAKAKGMVIWTIGFEVQDHGAEVMLYCASSPAHNFRVEGEEIKDAFGTIARQVTQLRLTQ